MTDRARFPRLLSERVSTDERKGENKKARRTQRKRKRERGRENERKRNREEEVGAKSLGACFQATVEIRGGEERRKKKEGAPEHRPLPERRDYIPRGWK